MVSAALIGSARAHDVQVPGSFDDLAFAEVTDGIFFVHEMQVLPDAENHGFMSNSGAVFTEDGVAIVDSGGSSHVVAAILDELAALTDQPVDRRH